MDDLAVAILRHEIGRHFEIVDEQHIVADAEPGFHAVGDGAGRDRVSDQARRHRGFFLAFFQQGLLDPVTVADPAGDEVVELVRRHLLVRGPSADPQA